MPEADTNSETIDTDSFSSAMARTSNSEEETSDEQEEISDILYTGDTIDSLLETNSDTDIQAVDINGSEYSERFEDAQVTTMVNDMLQSGVDMSRGDVGSDIRTATVDDTQEVI